MASKVLTLILGGGAGTRLKPLTEYRAKPAVPLGGKYRLIDVAVSNCINSNLRRIFVLTQYLSASLNRHVAQSYAFDQFSEGFVDILAAEQRAEDESWFQGTADAVRKHWNTLDNYDCDLVLILPGDALYRMNYEKMIEQHRASGAQITVAVNTVDQSQAHHFGLLAINEQGKITKFAEKPKTSEEQAGFEAPSNLLEQIGNSESGEVKFLASMGAYLFNRDVLNEFLMNTDAIDFGKQIIPQSIQEYNVQAHIFPGYWEDIGTIRAFYKAHMDFISPNPPFRFADQSHPIFTRPRFLPTSRFNGASIDRCVVADGCAIGKATIRKSIIGLRQFIGDHSTIEESVIMGADYFNPAPLAPWETKKSLPIGIGKYCHIRRAIIDKNVRMGDNVKILNEKNIENFDGDGYVIRDGLVIIPKNAVIPSGTII
jgi:glucose-1-phosphate adenylyltransferase